MNSSQHSHSHLHRRLLVSTFLLLFTVSQVSALAVRQLTKRVWDESGALGVTKHASSTSQKFVVAHDGFALNVGRDDWQPSRVTDAYAAAKGTNFKLFLSLDMSSLPCASAADIKALQNWTHLFRTFAGEGCTYGGNYQSTWSAFKNGLNVHFAPALFIDIANYQSLSWLDGAFSWNNGWPIQLTDSSSTSDIQQAVGNLNKSDQSWLQALGTKSYIAPLSPWFFTHYGPNTYNKNWLYRGDDWLFAQRWEQLFNLRSRFDIIEVISWNDYGESHYIGPIAGAQPMSQLWVNGFDHQGWLDLASYYIQAFKTGNYPSITQDKVYLWARPHPRDATASKDAVPRPQYTKVTDDFAWAVILAKADANITFYTPPPNTNIMDITSYNATIKAGVTKLKIPLRASNTMALRLRRAQTTVLDYRADGYIFNSTPVVYNYNAWVGSKVV
ncbi:related to glycoside hydrolase family 71 protein-Laccaria bicolor [Serendipita indica DSM 11827]|uniref:Related to glycoside hydrolase family 71 protein-Laccaria bicolor n=1 Tax=Serendipita indica (strain DSM 11827) TaxID=1109443 RepID=G4TG88_SERID|nr:related to glycoside hydrolase family 71 protein-Laccaria bicolor [Serendipita indica DSM 11827]